MIIGYDRVSTTDQNLDAQTDALTATDAVREKQFAQSTATQFTRSAGGTDSFQ
jgi:DNA invertase Pin-like site-specific DNA recombinase